MERLSDSAIDILNDLHKERLDYNSEYLPLIDALNALKVYEDIELASETAEEAKEAFDKMVAELAYYHKAEADGRLVITPKPCPDVDYRRVIDLMIADSENRLIVSPCAIGDKVMDERADYVFTVQKIETTVVNGKSALLFRCGNEGTGDYMAFFDYEIGEGVTVLPKEDASAT